MLPYQRLIISLLAIIICQYGRMILRDAKELADIQDTKSSYNELLKIQRYDCTITLQKISTVFNMKCGCGSCLSVIS